MKQAMNYFLLVLN